MSKVEEAIEIVKGRLNSALHGNVKVEVLRKGEKEAEMLVVSPPRYEAMARSIFGMAAFDVLMAYKVKVKASFALTEKPIEEFPLLSKIKKLLKLQF